MPPAGPVKNCSKVSYNSEAHAKRARAAVGRRKRFSSKLRVYECPKCGGWHLTSEEREGERA